VRSSSKRSARSRHPEGDFLNFAVSAVVLEGVFLPVWKIYLAHYVVRSGIHSLQCAGAVSTNVLTGFGETEVCACPLQGDWPAESSDVYLIAAMAESSPSYGVAAYRVGVSLTVGILRDYVAVLVGYGCGEKTERPRFCGRLVVVCARELVGCAGSSFMHLDTSILLSLEGSAGFATAI
jgi:hypothetical protein